MSYWCDDRGLALEQRRLDAQQAEALEKMRLTNRKICPTDSSSETNQETDSV